MAIQFVKDNKGKLAAIAAALATAAVYILAGDSVGEVLQDLVSVIFEAPVPIPQ